MNRDLQYALTSAVRAFLRCVVILGMAWVTTPIALLAADEPKVKVETLATGLSDPCGIAIQPSSDDVFVSDSGAGRIVKIAVAKPEELIPVIVGFPHEAAAEKQEPTNRSGPAGIAFLNEHTLVVGSSAKSGERSIRVFALPASEDSTAAKPVELESAKQKLGMSTDGDGTVSAEGKFYGLAVSPFAPPSLLVTNPGSSHGWIFKSEIKSWSSLEKLSPFTYVPAKYVSQFGLPSGGITVNRRGLLVVGMKRADVSKGGALAFFVAKKDAGGLLTAFPTALHDVVGLAYSPLSGRLYAADFSGSDPKGAGIYRLDATTIDGRAGVKTVKIATLDRPTALAFTSNNGLYVTVCGESNAEEGKLAGKLIRITGDL